MAVPSFRNSCLVCGLVFACALSGCASGGNRFSSIFGRKDAARVTQSQAEEEIEFIEEGLDNPKRLSLSYAQWRERIGDLSTAREHYRKALEEDPTSKLALLGLSRVNLRAGEFDLAEQGYLKALEADPEEPAALAGLARCAAEKKDWMRAGVQLEKAMRLAPENVQYQFDYGVVLAHQGRVAEAHQQFAQSVGDAEAHYNLGVILSELGRSTEAEAQLRQAIGKKPGYEKAQAMLARVRADRSPVQQASGTTSDFRGETRVTPANAAPIAEPATTSTGGASIQQDDRSIQVVSYTESRRSAEEVAEPREVHPLTRTALTPEMSLPASRVRANW